MSTRQSQKLKRRLGTLHAHPQFEVAQKIISALQKQSFEAVLAGGCVRDGLLDHPPKDLDIATSAPPEVVESTFTNTLAVGKAFGTIVVLEDGHNFEVTTFRRDGGYVDGRHPTAVEFTDMEEDAKRRDFTVNALFYDPVHETVFDFVEGIKDLDAGVLRTVGIAEERFGEDHLRMLRAPRFIAQLGFDLEHETLSAIEALHKSILKVSTERVFNEMRRLLSSPFASRGLEVLRVSGLAQDIWPEMISVNLERFESIGPFPSWENAFAAIMLLSGQVNAEMILRAWKAPRDSSRRVQALMDGTRELLNPATPRAGRMRILGGEEYAGILQLSAAFLPHATDVIQRWIKEFLEVSGETGKLPAPFLNGQDLIAAGIQPGHEMGVILKAIYDEQLEGNVISREQALAEVKKLAT